MRDQKMYLTKEAIRFLDKALNLPATGREQDWDIELADPNRVNEFVTYFETHDLDEGKKFALMALIMGSLEEASHGKAVPPETWEKVRRLLRENLSLYADLVKIWAPQGDDQDGFAISRLVRLL
jgi:hypothetical protein